MTDVEPVQSHSRKLSLTIPVQASRKSMSSASPVSASFTIEVTVEEEKPTEIETKPQINKPTETRLTGDGYWILTVIGNVKSKQFQQAKTLVLMAAQSNPKSIGAKILELAPSEWELYFQKQKQIEGGAWFRNGPVNAMVVSEHLPFVPHKLVLHETGHKYYPHVELLPSIFHYRRKGYNDSFENNISWLPKAEKAVIGDVTDLANILKQTLNVSDNRPDALYTAMAISEWSDWISKANHKFVRLNVQIGKKSVGDLLFNDICPKTCQNFLGLVKGTDNGKGKILSYQGSRIHRIVPDGWIQAGDIANTNGKTNESIYGPTFEDENFIVPHSHRGIISMANTGPHTNGSQFFITLKAMPCFDRLYVAFGRIVEGEKILRELEAVPLLYPERPDKEITIVECEDYSP